VPEGVGADPHVAIGRRDGELADPLENRLVFDESSVDVDVTEAFSRASPANARVRLVGIVQTRLFGGDDIGRDVRD
jgi:hypothetical protein